MDAVNKWSRGDQGVYRGRGAAIYRSNLVAMVNMPWVGVGLAVHVRPHRSSYTRHNPINIISTNTQLTEVNPLFWYPVELKMIRHASVCPNGPVGC